MSSIVTITVNPSVDKSSNVGQVRPEVKLRCGPPVYEPGGGSVNVSRAIKRLGGDSLAMYTSGGHPGGLLGELLDREGITRQAFPVSGLTRDNLIVYEESSGRQFRFGMPGPELSAEECDAMLSALSSLTPPPSYIVASGSLPPGVSDDFYARVARLARESGTRTVIDTSGGPLLAAAEEGVFLLKPNLRELRALSGASEEGESHIRSMAKEVLSGGKTHAIVVSVGSQGAFMVSKDGSSRVRAPTVPIRSKVGAGDSMVGGIVLKLSEGWELESAVKYGVAAGSAAVMTPGTELCRKEDTERIFREMESTAGGL
ncbi:MAG: 1-phosphofructokinase family hexose kinase [bacterium]